MYQLTACYVHPDNPTEFLEYYKSKHALLVRQFPRLHHFEWKTCETADGSTPPHFLIAFLQWDSRDDALAALASPAGKAAIDDLAVFASTGVDINLGELHVEM